MNKSVNKLIVLRVLGDRSIYWECDFLQYIFLFSLDGRCNSSRHQKLVSKTNVEGGLEYFRGVCPNARLQQSPEQVCAYFW